MKIVVTCGHPHSGFEIAHNVLVGSGLAEAMPSRREALTVAGFHEQVLKAHGTDSGWGGAGQQVIPGKVWEDLAVDFFRGNLAFEQWGWAAAGSAWLLEFWKAFDPQIRFLLVYSSPEQVVAQMLRQAAVPAEGVRRAMESWSAGQSELLRFFYRNRGLCVLANAARIRRAPGRFVAHVGTAFQLDLISREDDSEVAGERFSSLASLLVKGLVWDDGQAQATYLELEAAADLPAGEEASTVSDSGPAWDEYRNLLARVDEADRELRLRDEEVSRIKSERADEVRRTVEVQRDLDALKKEVERLKHAEQESVQEQQLDEMASEMQSAKTMLAAAETALKEQRVQNSELIKENESVLVQLHQVQEELEHYFLLYQELADASDVWANSAAVPAWGTMPPSEVVFDLRGEIDGDNWYHAEHDGRWAGPGPVSTLVVPALGFGQYEILLDVVDAMEPEILLATEVSLNGAPLDFAVDWKGYPAVGVARYTADAPAPDGKWRLGFKFPHLVSPAEHGSDDLRALAIRLRSLRVTAVGPDSRYALQTRV